MINYRQDNYGLGSNELRNKYQNNFVVKLTSSNMVLSHNPTNIHHLISSLHMEKNMSYLLYFHVQSETIHVPSYISFINIVNVNFWQFRTLIVSNLHQSYRKRSWCHNTQNKFHQLLHLSVSLECNIININSHYIKK